MPDPINNATQLLNVPGGALGLLTQVHAAAVAAGWIVDQFDTFPSADAGGAELYIHTNTNGFSEQSYFSFKAFNGQHADQSGFFIFANTGYSNTRRVDNQPGMFARSNNDIVNAASWTSIFSGLWDQAGANANPGDQGQYRTAAFPTVGPTPLLATNVPHLNCPLTTTIDKLWLLSDQVLSGGSRTLSAFWYLGNQLYGFSIGKVHYDNEGVSPDNVDGTLLAMWKNKFDDRNTNNLPANNAVGSSRTSATLSDAPIALIRNRTVSAVTWPAAAATGAPLLGVGPVVKSNDRLEASDGAGLVDGSMALRPELSFNSLTANLSDPRFPNPAVGVHRETFGGQNRVGLIRQRALSRWPGGGSLNGIDLLGNGPTDWSDSRYFFPWYGTCTSGEAEGAVISNGTRMYIIWPGNRGGLDLFALHRTAGLAFRVG